jgi:hypothetical protein
VKNGAAPVTGSSISLAVGDTASCKITNDDVAPTLLVKKHVVNNNGGGATADKWTLTVSSSNGGTGTGNAPGSESGTTYTLQTGKAYGVAESGGVSGYAQSSTGDCTIGSAVLGAIYVCTFTNDDKPAHLTLIKTEVTHPWDGTAVVGDFTLRANGPTSISGKTETPPVTNAEVSAGTYSLSENGPSGYKGSAWTCKITPGTGSPSGGTLTGSSLTLALDAKAECSISNEDLPATLTVIKRTELLGSTQSFNFTFAGSKLPQPPGAISFSLTGAKPGNAWPSPNVKQGTYTITEALGQDGTTTGLWLLDKIQCTGGNYQVNLATGTATIDLHVGDNVTCTFWNVVPRMTGGGSVFTDSASFGTPAGTRVTHGFTLHCGILAKKRSNNLEINWARQDGNQNNFKLSSLAGVICGGQPTLRPPEDVILNPEMPMAPFNTYTGWGYGSLNNGSPTGYFVQWQLVDNGEPGLNDTFSLTIWDLKTLTDNKWVPTGPTSVPPGATMVISFTGLKLNMGNHQAH